MRLSEICKNIETNHVVNLVKWSLIIRHDYPNMPWSDVGSIAKFVAPMHSLVETQNHMKSRGI